MSTNAVNNSSWWNRVFGTNNNASTQQTVDWTKADARFKNEFDRATALRQQAAANTLSVQQYEQQLRTVQGLTDQAEINQLLAQHRQSVFDPSNVADARANQQLYRFTGGANAKGPSGTNNQLIRRYAESSADSVKSLELQIRETKNAITEASNVHKQAAAQDLANSQISTRQAPAGAH